MPHCDPLVIRITRFCVAAREYQNVTGNPPSVCRHHLYIENEGRSGPDSGITLCHPWQHRPVLSRSQKFKVAITFAA